MSADAPERRDAIEISRVARVSRYLGVASLMLFAFSVAPSPTGIFLGLFGMLVASLGELPYFWPWLRRHALFWLALAFAAWLGLRGLAGSPFDIPGERASDSVHGLLRITGLLALLVGWWLIRLRDHLPAVLALVVAGLAINVLTHIDWHEISKYFTGFRPAFGIRGNGPSTFGAVVVIGCLALSKWVMNGRIRTRPRALMSQLAWAASLLFGVFLLLVGQSRSVWLATLAVAVLAIVVWLVSRGLHAPLQFVRRHPWEVAVGLLAGVVIGTVFGPLIVERMLREPETWRALFTLDFEQVASTSIGYRVAQWQIALETIAAHPLTGVGPGGAEAAMSAAAHPVLGDRTFPHFHNLYLEIAATIGLPGLLLFLAVLGCLAWYTWSGLQSGCRRRVELSTFVLAAGLMIALVSLFQIRHDDPHGMALIVLLSACAIAAAFDERENPLEGRSATLSRKLGEW